MEKKTPLSQERCLLLGQPGIGKSVCGNYFLLRALQEGHPVLYETAAKRYFFNPEKENGELKYPDAEVENVKTGSSLYYHSEDPKVLFIHDHDQDRPIPKGTDAFCVVPCFPDENNFKDFIKHKCLELWMPLTTAPEMEVMRQVLVGDGALTMTPEDLERRIGLAGPIPRLLFGMSEDFVIDEIEEKTKSFTFTASNASALLTKTLNPAKKQDEGVSWWILHVDSLRKYGKGSTHPPPNDYTKVTRVSWASDMVFTMVVNSQSENELRELEKIIAQSLGNPVTTVNAAGLYEKWTIQRVARGLDLKEETGVREKTLPVPCKKQPTLAEMMGDLKEYYRSVVVFPSQPNAPLFDACILKPLENNKYDLILLQSTIGKSHSFNHKHCVPFHEAMESDAINKVRLWFLVPHKTNFTPPAVSKSEFPKLVMAVHQMKPMY